MNDDESLIRLCSIKDIGSVTARRLIRAFGSAEAVLKASKDQLMGVERIGQKLATGIIAGADTDISEALRRMEKAGARYISYKNAEYPKLLGQIQEAPVGLYAVGRCNFNAPAIAIVGSRNCTIYGQITARKFASALAAAGYTIISGMARGIDAMAHLGAIESGGKTIAVLGSGVDVVYPPEHEDLYKKIVDNGAVISEFPMGARADRQNFPIRNRIVAAMALATLVVESDLKGGSMITARLASEYGRDVFAIPGRIDSAMSRGCNALIRDGAVLVSSPQEIIEQLKFGERVQMSLFFGDNPHAPVNGESGAADALKPKRNAQASEPREQSNVASNLSQDELILYNAIKKQRSIHIDLLPEISGFEMRKCLPLLTMLELKRLVKKSAGGIFEIID